jgi:hypothetical protein
MLKTSMTTISGSGESTLIELDFRCPADVFDETVALNQLSASPVDPNSPDDPQPILAQTLSGHPIEVA